MITESSQMAEQAEISLSPDVDFNGFGSDDFVVPRWTINKDNGEFVNNVTGQRQSELIVVIIRIGFSRLYWGKFYGSETELLCYSIDGIEPFDQSTPYGNVNNGVKYCDGCAMAQWKKSERPPCAEVYNYLIMEIDNDIPAVLSLSRSRFKVAKQLNTMIRFSGVRKTVKLWTEKEKSKNGEFYQLRFQQHGVNDDWKNSARAALKSKSLPMTSPPKPEETDDTEDNVPPQPETTVIDPETGEVV